MRHISRLLIPTAKEKGKIGTRAGSWVKILTLDFMPLLSQILKRENKD
jgi:hypothetical protein